MWQQKQKTEKLGTETQARILMSEGIEYGMRRKPYLTESLANTPMKETNFN